MPHHTDWNLRAVRPELELPTYIRTLLVLAILFGLLSR